MENQFILTSKEWYPWKKLVSTQTPWQRKLINVEYLNSERKRINKTKEWYWKYKRLKENEAIEEINFYVSPIELDYKWTALISSKEYIFKGLSALPNDYQIFIIMLLDRNRKIPQDYSYIK